MFVRVRGDVADVNAKVASLEAKLSRLEGATKRVNSTMQSAGLQTGRLGNQFASLAGQIAGVHPIVGNLAQVMGNFAIGGAVTVGILGATAIFATFYDTLTKGARQAKEANDKLVKSLNDRIFREGLGPAGDLRLETDAERNKLRGLQSRERTLRAFRGGDDKEVLDLQRQIIESQKTLAAGEAMLEKARFAAGKGLVDVMVRGGAETAKVVKQVKDLSFSLQQLRTVSDEFWGPMNRFNEAFALPSLIDPMTPGEVDISDSVKIAGKIGKEINAGTEQAERDAQMVKDAIWGSAAQLANSIVSSLNIGGGGKGSNLGGAIGGTAGFAAGFMIGGPAGGAIGSLIGNIGGSFLGGLFDHKKAIEVNTNAVRQNTAALLLNSPSGYKTASGRFDATEVKEFRRGLQRYATRGGAPILVSP